MNRTPLPPRPNLAQYRKQAKELLRAYRLSDPDAIHRFARYHPRLARRTEAGLNSAPCVLADAQLVLAREHGCDTWATFSRQIRAVLQPHASSSSTPASESLAAHADLHQVLEHAFGQLRPEVGVIVGVTDSSGWRTVGSGSTITAETLNGDTVFEIGSVTMVFTVLLLMEMVGRGEVALSDPVATHLPASVKVPVRNGRVITLLDLATHRSGLPVIPKDLRPRDPLDPLADFSADILYDFLSAYELPRDIDAKQEFSVLGLGLLGHALERRAGMDYELLLRRRVLGPLGLNSTGIADSPHLKARMAKGFHPRVGQVAPVSFGVLAGAGGLRSTAHDLLMFLDAVLGAAETPLRAELTNMLLGRRSVARSVPFGWIRMSHDGAFSPSARHVFWMGSGTVGSRAFAGFEPQAKRGVVVLANCFSPTGNIADLNDVDNLGLHLLDPGWPLDDRLGRTVSA